MPIASLRALHVKMVRRSRALLCTLMLVASLCPMGVVQAEGLSGLVYPVMSPRKSSDFGIRVHPIYKVRKHHYGVDLAAPKGAYIRSVKEGTVVFADPYKGYGNLVVVKHGDGLTTHYGHCDTIKVRPGQHVVAGQIIATVGATGNVTGPHLHLEVRRDGKPLNPERFIPGLGEKSKG